MPASEVAPVTEREKVERWREEQLLDAGYPPQEAHVLASRFDVDLHRAVAMRAASPDLAFEILV